MCLTFVRSSNQTAAAGLRLALLSSFDLQAENIYLRRQMQLCRLLFLSFPSLSTEATFFKVSFSDDMSPTKPPPANMHSAQLSLALCTPIYRQPQQQHQKPSAHQTHTRSRISFWANINKCPSNNAATTNRWLVSWLAVAGPSHIRSRDFINLPLQQQQQLYQPLRRNIDANGRHYLWR